VLVTKCYYGDQIEKVEVCGTWKRCEMLYKYCDKFELKRPLERSRRRRNLRMDLKRSRVGGCGLDLSGSEQGAVAGTCVQRNEIPIFIGGGGWNF